ncbi:uncharacterized protein LY89DRAFT_575632, partial [Mollisia scopiformis]
MSEAFPPPSHNLGSLWSSLWEVDRSQWRWQAPRAQDPVPREVTPSRVYESTEWKESTSRSAAKKDFPRTKAATKPSIHKDISAIRHKLKLCQTNDLPALCNDFNQLFKHNLTLGTVSEIAITDALRSISKDLHNAFPGEAATHCLSFYKATWDGLLACRVLQVEQLGNGITQKLMQLLAKLPSTSDVLSFALSIIPRLSRNQQDGAR